MSTPSTQNTAAASQPTAQDPLPAAQTLLQASKLAIQQDKPIQLDYFVDTYFNRAFLGEDADNNEKMLVKSGEEFTSSIQKIYKVSEDFIIITENSIYIVSAKMQKRRIKAPALRAQIE